MNPGPADQTGGSGRPGHGLWPAGAASGVGSMPGSDPVDAAKLVFDELPDLPYLPELPGRGPGADMLGRTAAVLVDLPVDLQPSGWRLVPRPGLDLRRARGLLERDLDALTKVASGYVGVLKIAIVGPWTLAAGVELPRGHKALADPGATRDLSEGLAEGLRGHLAEIGRRVPGARILLQVDEPSLPIVLAGRVRTPSGFSVLPAVEEGPVETGLSTVLDAATEIPAVAGAGVHCCARDVPITLLRRAGARFIGLDATLLTRDQDEPLGEAVEAGIGLLLGLVPAAGGSASEIRSDPRRIVAPAVALWGRLGFRPERLGEVVGVTPACGLAGMTDAEARATVRLCRQAAGVLVESPE